MNLGRIDKLHSSGRTESTPTPAPDLPSGHEPTTLRRLSTMSDDSSAQALYARVGGRDFFVGLVDRFYVGVEVDPVLRPMYDDEDLAPAKQRLVAFLSQYFGGTAEYEELRGSPMLRARHLKFPIDEAAKDVWLVHMGAALDDSEIPAADREELWRYFVAGANFFVNRGGLGLTGA